LLYPEFQPHVGSCRYKDCLHLDEPQCAVLEAKRAGKISSLRYENYCRIVASLRQKRR
jgi:ribosome biogenesis GTPase